MHGKMDKADKKRTDLKGKKSAKKFMTAAKQKTGDKPEQHFTKKSKHLAKGDKKIHVKQEAEVEKKIHIKQKGDSEMAVKIEKNKGLLKMKKERQQKASDSGENNAAKRTKQDRVIDKSERKAAWKKGRPDGKKMWKKGKGVKDGKGESKDDRPKLEEMTKKERKLVRKKTKSNYELGIRAKQIWEKVRDHKCSADTRAKLLDELYGLIKGRAKELVLAHDTVRVIQCCVQYGNDKQRQGIFDEVKDNILELCKSKYGKFYVLKVLRYGTRQQRDYIIKSFYGNVCKLVQHSIAAEIVETAYNNWANAQHRSALLEEFYGAKYAVFKESGIHTLGEIINKQPESKQTILEHMLKVLTPLLEKSVIKHTIVHKVLLDFLMHAPIKLQAELIQLMREVVVQILHTHDGSRAAMYCFWFGTTKDRKMMIKSFKTYVARICKEEYGHRVLMSLFDVVDDTKLVNKVIIEEMMKSVSEIAHDQYGRKVLLYLLTPRNPTHFHPDIVKQLKVGDENPNSKKDVLVRRRELLEAASPALLQFVTEECKEMVINKSSSQLMLAVLEFSHGNKKEAFQAIADLAAEEFVPTVMDSEENVDKMHIVEHPSGHFFLRCLLMQEKSLLEKGEAQPPVLFSDILLDTVSAENLRSWCGTNRSAFVLVSLADSPREKVKLQLKVALKPVMKSLKTNSTKGCMTLLSKLQ